MSSTPDRADVLSFAARHHRSPALAEGAPALLAHGEVGARCGWAPFFSALGARGETLVLASDGSSRTAPRGAPPSPSELPAPSSFLHLALATLRALRAPRP